MHARTRGRVRARRGARRTDGAVDRALARLGRNHLRRPSQRRGAGTVARAGREVARSQRPTLSPPPLPPRGPAGADDAPERVSMRGQGPTTVARPPSRRRSAALRDQGGTEGRTGTAKTCAVDSAAPIVALEARGEARGGGRRAFRPLCPSSARGRHSLPRPPGWPSPSNPTCVDPRAVCERPSGTQDRAAPPRRAAPPPERVVPRRRRTGHVSRGALVPCAALGEAAGRHRGAGGKPGPGSGNECAEGSHGVSSGLRRAARGESGSAERVCVVRARARECPRRSWVLRPAPRDCGAAPPRTHP